MRFIILSKISKGKKKKANWVQMGPLWILQEVTTSKIKKKKAYWFQRDLFPLKTEIQLFD